MNAVVRKVVREATARAKDDEVVKWALAYVWANLSDPDVRDMLRENGIAVQDVAKALDARGVEHAPRP